MEKGSLTALSYVDDKTLATIYDQKRVCFWDARSGKRLRRLSPKPSFGRILAVSAGGTWLAGLTENNRVGVWDCAAGKMRWQKTKPTNGVSASSSRPMARPCGR